MICRRCGAERPDAELNIEGAIHHRTPVHCLDQKACNRRRRRTEQRKPNRERARAPKLGRMWCGACDAAKVASGAKCPRCGAREPHRKLRG